jgi:ATP/maltotriose-dependent transcriptional regulator MalT
MGDITALLEAAGAALEAGAYEDARDKFLQVLAVEDIPEAQEGLAWAAAWLNEADLAFGAREAAFRQYRARGDEVGAARQAIWLSTDYVEFRGEMAVASGWRERAHRILDALPVTPEHGWLAVIEGDLALCYADDTEVALGCAGRALEIGKALGDSSIEVMGLAMQGIAMVTEGAVEDGMRRLDEAAAIALSGELQDPVAISWAVCYLIFACERVRDLNRAEEWCKKLGEFADQQKITQTQGICRIHYASVLIWRGMWDEAESQLADASGKVAFSRLLRAEGVVRLADLRRRQGRMEEAEALFRQADWHPLAWVGLAELALDDGKPLDARELVERALRHVPERSRTQRAAAYELQCRAEALLGRHNVALQAYQAVQSLSEAVATLPLRAAASFSAGAVAIGERDFEVARAHLEDALGLYERSGAPYESARARLDLASVLVSLDRLEPARREAEAALQMLEQLGARLYAARARALLQDIERRSSEPVVSDGGPLTGRQVEILRLIARGLNDHEIAATLVVSEHTVHRHVANILQRLNLPSRAAAVAYAAGNGLIPSP